MHKFPRISEDPNFILFFIKMGVEYEDHLIEYIPGYYGIIEKAGIEKCGCTFIRFRRPGQLPVRGEIFPQMSSPYSRCHPLWRYPVYLVEG